MNLLESDRSSLDGTVFMRGTRLVPEYYVAGEASQLMKRAVFWAGNAYRAADLECPSLR